MERSKVQMCRVQPPKAITSKQQKMFDDFTRAKMCVAKYFPIQNEKNLMSCIK